MSTPLPSDEARVRAAMARFRAFFDELRSAFVERGDVLAQIALALLAREHVLVAGPPGTAKSQLASAALGRIVCEESGSPSLFARQITESTVQTDLIGPIDFKNLTETGRTMHFTDEGLLGNVHAFLDEVFDGRDMLLRSALNLLQEREVKQGGTIARGRIECALMTSNRYISEVLEQSRETLLAFVDRIGFIGFVPRGFADPDALATVLRRNVGGVGRPKLDALLTIQDLDVLQAAVDDVYVAPELCDSVAELLGSFDAEISQATRADPSFSPTRYISTRTAVRCGGLLRAACMFDRIFRDASRPNDATRRDFELLRLHLVLCGPTPEHTQKLLEREVDPVEKRQLAILRTERELFDACLAKLPASKPLTPRPRKPTPTPKRPQAPDAKPTERDEAAQGDAELAQLEARIASAHSAGDAQTLLALARRVADLARDGAPQVARARALLERATRAAAVIGMATTLDRATGEEPPLMAVRAIVSLARSLQDGTASMHATARWMHERALDLVGDAALYASSADSKLLDAGASKTREVTRERLATLEELGTLRRQLLSESATRAGNEPEDETWSRAMSHAEGMLAAWFSRSFAEVMKQATALSGTLDATLGVIGDELTSLGEVDARLSAVAGRTTTVKERVAGPRLSEIVKRAVVESHASERLALIKQIRDLCGVLDKHGLRGAIEPTAWLEWTTSCLIRGESQGRAEAPASGAASLEGYRALRASGHRVAIACTLAEVALLVGGSAGSPELHPPALLDAIPVESKAAIIDADIGRIERSVEYLERWFSAVAAASLEDAKRSRFFELLWDEAALARFSMEARLVEELLPTAAERTKRLRARIDALNARAHERGVALLEQASDEVWAGAAR